MYTSDSLLYNESVLLFRSLRRCAVRTPTAPAAVTAYSYLRFSSPAQAEGDSVRRQTALRDAWLKRHPEVILDTSLKLVDAGVSGFRGEHRKNRRHALASFLDLVHRGRVPAGSYLIVENLDRLSREHPLEVMGLVGELVRAGVRVVQLAPETVFTADMDEGALCMLLLGSIRGHGESQRKSNTCGAAWGEKKDEARADRTPHGKAVPAWLELAGGKYRVREDAGRAVRRIFELSAGGLGTLAIVGRLGGEGVAPIGRARRWQRSYVQKILDNPAVKGEYQPMNGHRGRTPDGEPIRDYFPRVVSDALWAAAHRAKDSRNKRSGRPARKGDYLFPFSGMLSCALDGCKLHVLTRKGKKFLCSANAAQGVPGSHWRLFPVDVLTREVLTRLEELQASDLFNDPGAGRVAEIEGRLAAVERRLAVALERFDADPESPTWAKQVDRYDREQRALVAEKKDAQQQAACPLSASWAEAVELMAADDPERLRAALLRTIAEMPCLFVNRGRDKLAAVQVWFQTDDGRPHDTHRDYVIWWRQPTGGAAGRRTPKPLCRSVADAGLAVLDLRDRSQAAELAADLAAVHLAE
jgi:DNA invertase Pin-like site-specific DNA recombinase